MSPQEKDDAVTEDASVEQIHAAEPDRPEPAPSAPVTVDDPGTVDDPDELRAQIEETREGLGDTVEALTHKLDVKARAKDGIDERKQAAKEGVAHAKETLTETAAQAKATLADAAATAQAKASGAAAAAQDRATEATAGARDAATDAAATAQQRAEQAGRHADENRVPVTAVAVVAGVLLVVVVWRRRSR